MGTPTSRLLQVKGSYKYFKAIKPTNERDKWGSVYWLCECICGTEFKAVASKIRNTKDSLSCGCIYRKGFIKPDGYAAFSRIFRNYKSSAKRRSLDFKLSEYQFKALTKSLCYYCGCLPSATIKSGFKSDDYVYNGIDRLDNTQGYTLENSVPCCAMCNSMKSNHSYQDFISKCIEIANKQSK